MKKKKGKLTLSKETVSMMGMKMISGGDDRTKFTKCYQITCDLGCSSWIQGDCISICAPCGTEQCPVTK